MTGIPRCLARTNSGFSGQIAPDKLNQGWNDLRLQYQGITPPVQRTEADFDPGAKFHIPGNTPYARYFLARILQFQFYKAACDMAGWKGPLHRCSFYGNKQVGQRLNAMLEMGASKPWPDALEAFTGTREMSGKPIAHAGANPGGAELASHGSALIAAMMGASRGLGFGHALPEAAISLGGAGRVRRRSGTGSGRSRPGPGGGS